MHRPFFALLLLAALPACGGDDAADSDAGVFIDENDAAIDASTVGPPAAEALQASFTGPCPRTELDWTNPDDAAFDTVIVLRRVGGAVEDLPEDGRSYSAGEILDGGAEVIFQGDGDSLVDDSPFFHGVTVGYAVFTATPEKVYGSAAATEVEIDLRLGAQEATAEIDLGSGNVTVQSAPSFPLTVQASFDDGTNRLELDLSLLNESCRAVHNLKAVVANVDDKGATVFGDLLFDGQQALHYGVGATAANSSKTRPLVIENISEGSATLTVELQILDHPSLLVGGLRGEAGRLIDSSGAFDSVGLLMSTLNFRNSGHGKEGIVSPDGEKLIVGHGEQPVVVTVDLASNFVIGTADLTGANDIRNDGSGSVGHVPSLAMSPDHQYIYAVLVSGDHSNYACGNGSGGSCNVQGRIDGKAPSTDIELIRLEGDTLLEVDRLPLLEGSALRPLASNLSLSADGTRAALALRREGSAFVIDLETMELVDGDPDSPGEQPFDLSQRSTEPHRVALNADGSELFVAYRGEGRGGPVSDETLDRIDLATGAVSNIGVSTNSLTRDNRSGALSIGPDGRLYYARKNGAVALSIFDNGSEVEVGPGERALAVIHGDLDTGYFLWDGSRLRRFDYQGDVPLPFVANGLEELLYTGSFGHLSARSPL